jgi:murein DD-endopeptidase MepM/ murein hydrolase activator NlpD
MLASKPNRHATRHGLRRCRIALLCALSLVAAALVPLSSALAIYPATTFVYPLITPRVSSNFGMRVHPIRRFSKKHSGIDLAAPRGAVIRSIAAGTVIFADRYKGYGNLVIVKHSETMTSHYGHCEEIRIRPGQRVRAGEIIATVGSTGLSTGPHLHLELHVNGVAQDPERYLPGLAEMAAG